MNARGAQVLLEGFARLAARGGAGASLRSNNSVMESLVLAGLVSDGNSQDGSSKTGAKPYDSVVAQFQHEPVSAYEIPAPLLQIDPAALLAAGAGLFLPLAGGVLTGPLTLDGSTPTVGAHAASKAYVDLQIGGGGVGPFLKLSGGAVTGSVSIGTASTNNVQIAGGSGITTVVGAGTGNTQLQLRGKGSGATGQVNIGTDTGGGALFVVGAAATGSGGLRITQPVNATTRMVVDMLTNTAGLDWQLPTRFTRSWTYSGLSTDAANQPLWIVNTIAGTSGANTPLGSVPVLSFKQIYNSFVAAASMRGLEIYSQINAGSYGKTFNAATIQLAQNAQPGTAPNWAASTGYATLGSLVINGGLLYALTQAGTSASSGGPTGSGTSITDGTCRWDWMGQDGESYYTVALGVQSTVSFNVGGTAVNPRGIVFGAVFGSNSTAAATNYSQSVAVEIDDDFKGTSTRTATLQLVKRGVNGSFQDWGISFYGKTADWRNPILFQSAVATNGYAIAFEDQNNAGFQAMAGVLDMRQVTPTGTGKTGGGFFLRWPNGTLDSDGAVNLRYGRIAPTATGLTIDTNNLELTAVAVTAGGSGWQSTMWATDQYGNVVSVATVSGTAVATVTLRVAGQVDGAAPPASSTFMPLHLNTSAAPGTSAIPTAFTATLTYAAAATPTVTIGGSAITSIAGKLKTSALLTNAANDAAAASAGVGLNEFYRNGSIIMQRTA